MKKRLPEIFAVVLILLAIVLAIHQHFGVSRTWLSFHQIWTHETLIAIFVSGAVCLIIGKYLGKIDRKE